MGDEPGVEQEEKQQQGVFVNVYWNTVFVFLKKKVENDGNKCYN